MDYQNNYEQTQLNILIGQSANNACMILNTKYNGDIDKQEEDFSNDFDEELIELTKRLAQDILTARKEFAGELPDMKIIEAIKNVNKDRPLISLELTDFEKASEPQKTLINELKLMLNRLDTKERKSGGTHAEFKAQASNHFNMEEGKVE